MKLLLVFSRFLARLAVSWNKSFVFKSQNTVKKGRKRGVGREGSKKEELSGDW